jgi:trimeric autotransporter adhesin
MHPWARRGLQSALFAGGMLMLGTGIASADDNLNPDMSPGPVDGGVSVPFDVENNAIGTPFGQQKLPAVKSSGVSTGKTLGNVSAPLGDSLLGNKVVPEVAVPLQAANNAIGAGGDVQADGEAHQVHQQGGPITTTGKGRPVGGNVVSPAGEPPDPAEQLGVRHAVHREDERRGHPGEHGRRPDHHRRR